MGTHHSFLVMEDCFAQSEKELHLQRTKNKQNQNVKYIISHSQIDLLSIFLEAPSFSWFCINAQRDDTAKEENYVAKIKLRYINNTLALIRLTYLVTYAAIKSQIGRISTVWKYHSCKIEEHWVNH